MGPNVYLISGSVDGSSSKDVYMVFTSVSMLSSSRLNGPTVLIGNKAYVLSGYTGFGSVNTVESAPLQ